MAASDCVDGLCGAPYAVDGSSQRKACLDGHCEHACDSSAECRGGGSPSCEELR